MTNRSLRSFLNQQIGDDRAVHLRWCVVVFFTGLFFVVNQTVADRFDVGPDGVIRASILGLLIGMVLGQLNLISVWAAMSPGRVAIRLPWSIMLTVLLWYSVTLGDSHRSANGTVELGIYLIVAQVIAQIPLWIGSQVFRYRLTSRIDVAHGRQFSIRDMLLGTVLLAITLSLCRFLIPNDPIDWSEMNFVEPQAILVLAIVVVANQITVVPGIWAAFRSRRRLPLVAIFGFAALLLVTALEFAVMAILIPFGPDAATAFLFLGGINLGQAATVFGTLLVLRYCGFLLLRIQTPAGG